MLENNVIGKGMESAHKSRYIISWLKAGGELYCGKDVDDFREWLLSMDISNDEVTDIVEMATMGKFELEKSAMTFMIGKSIERYVLGK